MTTPTPTLTIKFKLDCERLLSQNNRNTLLRIVTAEEKAEIIHYETHTRTY